MEMSLRKQQEERHADIYLSRARLHTDAKRVALTILVYFAVVAMIPRTTQGIWFMLVSLQAIAVAVTVETQKHGDSLCTAQYIQHTQRVLRVMGREQHLYPPTWLRVYG